MAERLPPTGFWSYTTSDDRSSGGHLSQLRVRLANALQLVVGRQQVQIFQDANAIPLGAEWENEIDKALAKSCFLIPIITPGFLGSKWCCKEVLRFRERERELGRSDLIFPFIYINVDDIDPHHPDECFDRTVFELLNKRQRFDFHSLRHYEIDRYEVRVQLDKLAGSINQALRRSTAARAGEVNPKTVVTPASAGARPILAPGTVIRDIPDAPELVLIPKGTFTMGVPPQEEERENVPENIRGWSVPRQAITIAKPFWLGKYQVTRGQFATFVAEEGHATADEAWTFEPDDKGRWDYKVRKNRNWRNPGFEQTDNDPVVCVSHEDAMAYVGWLGRVTGKPYRLPSEAEWEYAARAGTTTARFWGDGRAEAARYANVADRTLMARMGASFDPERFFEDESGYAFTAPVGSFLPNPFGLYDMLGNVWEWTADVFNETLRGIPLDGTPNTTGDSSRRVVRGGSWDYSPRGVRAGGRYWDSTGDRNSDTGFRVARTLFYPES